MKLSAAFAGLAIGLLAAVCAHRADATVTFSFANMPLSDTWGGGVPLDLSGSFSLPSLPDRVLDNTWTNGLAGVDLTVTSGGATVASFLDPSVFRYAAGTGADGTYWVNIETSYPIFFGLSVRDAVVLLADFVSPTSDYGLIAGHGYSYSPFPASGLPIAATTVTTEDAVISEPGSISLLALAVGSALVLSRRQRL